MDLILNGWCGPFCGLYPIDMLKGGAGGGGPTLEVGEARTSGGGEGSSYTPCSPTELRYIQDTNTIIQLVTSHKEKYGKKPKIYS